jgi:hypothetical protein
MTPKRQAYWDSEIVFDCPLTQKRHTIEQCFRMCEMWGKNYLPLGDGSVAAFLFCHADYHGERYLHDGKITRDT